MRGQQMATPEVDINQMNIRMYDDGTMEITVDGMHLLDVIKEYADASLEHAGVDEFIFKNVRLVFQADARPVGATR